MTDTSKVTRVEVIEMGVGREYVQWGLYDVELALQDVGRTLKVFVKHAEESRP